MTAIVTFKDAAKKSHVVELAGDNLTVEEAEEAARANLEKWEDHGTTSYKLPLTLVGVEGAVEPAEA